MEITVFFRRYYKDENRCICVGRKFQYFFFKLDISVSVLMGSSWNTWTGLFSWFALQNLEVWFPTSLLCHRWQHLQFGDWLIYRYQFPVLEPGMMDCDLCITLIEAMILILSDISKDFLTRILKLQLLRLLISYVSHHFW